MLAWPSLALASCVAPPPFPEAIRDAPAVFVGVVVDVEDEDRTATVEIQDVWKGADIPPEVGVRGGLAEGNGFTSVDRTFELSREYLFVPYERNGSMFRDNACTRTTRFRPELNRFRPGGAGEPSPTPSVDTPSPNLDEENGLPWLPVGAVLVVSALIVFVLLRRR